MTVLVLMGVAGSGKSTVAAVLHGRLGWDFAEGDDMHPAANVEKMRAGHPLTDDDRWPWLARIATWIDEHVQQGRSGLVTCSALKRRYRDLLRNDHPDAVTFVYFHGSHDQIAARLTARHGHYMPAALLDSQFADLEPPGPDEHALTVDITASPTEQTDLVMRELGLQ